MPLRRLDLFSEQEPQISLCLSLPRSWRICCEDGVLRSCGAVFLLNCFSLPKFTPYLKSDGRLSDRLHFSHSATFLTLPLSKRVFIFISPPQEHINLCVALAVRLFLLACPIVFLLYFNSLNKVQNYTFTCS